jgi:parallel beta-helix repeat protein
LCNGLVNQYSTDFSINSSFSGHLQQQDDLDQGLVLRGSLYSLVNSNALELERQSQPTNVTTPIEINSDLDFANNYFSGNGSQENPYTLENVSLNHPVSSLISIRNTRAHFIIKNSLFNNMEPSITIINAVHEFPESSGIILRNVSNGQFINNTFISNSVGLAFFNSSYNFIVNNSFLGSNFYGIHLRVSPHNTIEDNIFNGCGLEVDGKSLPDYIQHSVINNLINGKPLEYIQNQKNLTLQSVGSATIINSTNVQVDDSDVSYSTNGIFVGFSENIKLSSIKSRYSHLHGIQVNYSSDISITTSSITDTSIGIRLQNTSNISITSNAISNVFIHGVYVNQSHHTYLYNNSISISGRYDIGLRLSNFSSIIFNNLSNSAWYGLDYRDSSHGRILNNTFIETNSAIRLYTLFFPLSGNNTIEFNNFVLNGHGISPQVNDQMSNNLYIHNYWDEWTTPDENTDGIVDDEYVINSDQTSDTMPLVSPAHSPDHLHHEFSEMMLIFPDNGELQDKVINIYWTESVDSWSHEVSYSLYIMKAGDSSWKVLAIDLDETFFVFNITSTVDERVEFFIKITALDNFDRKRDQIFGPFIFVGPEKSISVNGFKVELSSIVIILVVVVLCRKKYQ